MEDYGSFNGLIFRNLRVNDFEKGITEIAIAEYRNALESEEKYRKVFEDRKKLENYCVQVVAEDLETQRIVGVAAAVVERKYIRGGGSASHLEFIYVKEEYRHRGVGSKLIDILIDNSKRLGCYKIILFCENVDSTFFEKFGFKAKGVSMKIQYS